MAEAPAAPDPEMGPPRRTTKSMAEAAAALDQEMDEAGIVRVIFGGEAVTNREAVEAATRKVSGDPFLAARVRAEGRKVLENASPIEYVVERALKFANGPLMVFAGALAGSAGCTTRETRSLLRAAGPRSNGGGWSEARTEATRALRAGLEAAGRRRAVLGPVRGAYFDVRGGLELPGLPWPLATDARKGQRVKEYGVSMWIRVARRPTATDDEEEEEEESSSSPIEIFRLCTKGNLGVSMRLKFTPTTRFELETAHAPHGWSSRIVQTIDVPAPDWRFDRWHHVHVEARGRPRFALFARDEASVWIDGRLRIDRASFAFPSALSSSSSATNSTDVVLDDCAFGRGLLRGQLAGVVLTAEANAAIPFRAAAERLAAKQPLNCLHDSYVQDPRRVRPVSADGRAAANAPRSRAGNVVGGGIAVSPQQPHHHRGGYGVLSDEYLDDACADVATALALRYEPRAARDGAAYDASPNRRHAVFRGRAFAVPDLADGLSALGGVWLLVALFLGRGRHEPRALRDGFSEEEEIEQFELDDQERSVVSSPVAPFEGETTRAKRRPSPPPVPLLLDVLAAAVGRSGVLASELSRLGLMAVVERVCCGECRRGPTGGDASQLVPAIFRLRAAARMSPPLAAQVETRLVFTSWWPRRGDSLLDALLAAANNSPRVVDGLIGVPRLVQDARRAETPRARRALLAAAGVLIVATGLSRPDAHALLAALAFREDEIPVAADTARLVLALLKRPALPPGVPAGLDCSAREQLSWATTTTTKKNNEENTDASRDPARPAEPTSSSSAESSSTEDTLAFDEFCVAVLVDSDSERLRALGLRLVAARLELEPRRFDAVAPVLFDVLSRRAGELQRPAFTALRGLIAGFGRPDVVETSPVDEFDAVWEQVGDPLRAVCSRHAPAAERATSNVGKATDAFVAALLAPEVEEDPGPWLLVAAHSDAAAAPLGLFFRVAPLLSARLGLEVLSDLEQTLAVPPARASLAANRDAIPCVFALARGCNRGASEVESEVESEMSSSEEETKDAPAAKKKQTDRFELAMRAYAALLLELVPTPLGATAVALSVAVARDSDSRRVLRGALSHVFAKLLDLASSTRASSRRRRGDRHWAEPADVSFSTGSGKTRRDQSLARAHIIRLVFVACALIENHDRDGPLVDLTRAETVTANQDDAKANVLLAVQAREVAGVFVLGGRDLQRPKAGSRPGGLRAVAPPRIDLASRTAARPLLFSDAGALPGQHALVFELLRLCAAVALPALDPASAQAAVNLGWTRYLLAAVLDACESSAARRDRALKSAQNRVVLPWCAVQVSGQDDALEGDRKQAVAWTLAVVSHLRDALARARTMYFGPAPTHTNARGTQHRDPATPSKRLRSASARAAAVAGAREGSIALRDALTRPHSPLPRFVDAATLAAMRQMLDEAGICRRLAAELRVEEDEARRQAAGAKWRVPEKLVDDDYDALLLAGLRDAEVRRAGTEAPVAPASSGYEPDPEPSPVPSRRTDERSRRLGELRWLRVAWLASDAPVGSDDVPRLRSVASKLSASVRAAGAKGLDQASGTGHRACAQRFDVLVPPRETSRRLAAADKARDRLVDAFDAALVARTAADVAEKRAAKLAATRLRAACRRPGWSPFSPREEAFCADDSEKTACVSDSARVPKRLRVATTHRDALGRRSLLVRQSRFKSHADLAYPGNHVGGKKKTKTSASVTSTDDIDSATETESSDSDFSDVEGPVRAVPRARWTLPNSCDAEYEVHLVQACGAVPGSLFLTPQFLYFGPADASLETRRWRLDGLTAVRGRRYLLKRTGLEFFFASRREVFVAFNNGQDRRLAWRHMKRVAFMPLVAHPPGGTRSIAEPKLELAASGLVDRWRRREISNFAYLMGLNCIAGRTYHDLAQYFVFPWVVCDYETATPPRKIRRAVGGRMLVRDADDADMERLWNQQQQQQQQKKGLQVREEDAAAAEEASKRDDRAFYRDLSKPIGALNPERLQVFKERLKTADFMYGSHYSSAGTVLHFLVRLEPYTSRALELFGGNFDVADRLFFDVAESWRNGTTSASDVKELVPEFYYCPSLFRNDNAYPLGALQDGRPVDDVRLPAWCPEGDAEAFVRANRAALESAAVDDALPRWIDLIFGAASTRGPGAAVANNVFHPYTYEGAVDFDAIVDPTLKDAVRAQIAHFGQTPLQLFDAPHPRREPPGSRTAAPRALFDDDDDDDDDGLRRDEEEDDEDDDDADDACSDRSVASRGSEDRSVRRDREHPGAYFVYQIFPPPKRGGSFDDREDEDEDVAQEPQPSTDPGRAADEDEFVDLDLNSDDDRSSRAVACGSATASKGHDDACVDMDRAQEQLPEFLARDDGAEGSPVASICVLQNQRLAVVHADQTVATLRYPLHPGGAKLETKRQFPSRDLSSASPPESSDSAAGDSNRRYAFVAATPGGFFSASDRKATYAKHRGAAPVAHSGAVTVDVVGAPGVGDTTRIVSVGYLDGAVRAHGALAEDRHERTAVARRSGASRSCAATCIAASECGRCVATGHADGTATVWVNDFGDLAAVLASDDVLVAAARGNSDGLGAAALRTWRLHAVKGPRRPNKPAPTTNPTDDDWGLAAFAGDDEARDDDARLRAALAVVDPRLLAAADGDRLFSEGLRLPAAKRVATADGASAVLPHSGEGLARALDRELKGRAAAGARTDAPLSAVHVLRGSDLPVADVDIRADADLVLVAAADGSVAVHTLRRGRFVRVLAPASTSASRSAAAAAAADTDAARSPRVRHLCRLAPHGYVASALVDVGSGPQLETLLRAFSINESRPLAQRRHPGAVAALTLSRSGDFLVVAGDAPTLDVLYLHDLTLAYRIPLSGLEDRPFAPVTAVAFARGHDVLFLGTADGCIHVCARSPQ